jgi:hypothetical protein
MLPWNFSRQTGFSMFAVQDEIEIAAARSRTQRWNRHRLGLLLKKRHRQLARSCHRQWPSCIAFTTAISASKTAAVAPHEESVHMACAVACEAPAPRDGQLVLKQEDGAICCRVALPVLQAAFMMERIQIATGQQ